MKKSNLIKGIVYILIGTVCLLIALFTDTRLESLLCGFAGGGIVPGIMMVYKYYYWTSPQNREEYLKKQEKEQIELHDELKEKVRCKTAQYVNYLSLFVIAISSVVFAILDSLEIVENGGVFTLYLCGYLFFQIMCQRIIFQRIMKQY